jgi:inosine-uridine nucleoside N-ribohydrolase
MSDPVLVDTDPGIYDALAHHYLVATGGWDLKAVAGILPLPWAVANARGLAALLGIERDVPVQALSEKSPGSDPQLGLGQVALGPRRFRRAFRRPMDAQ